ncbi:hypothetical protein H6F38_20540 [Paenibacillus sp. EKM208P]|nr:hypothetical protein H6F38_20540 [Paenibacillus sp. EKM208P]
MIILMLKLRDKRRNSELLHSFLTAIIYFLASLLLTYLVVIKWSGTTVYDYYHQLKNSGFFEWYIPYVCIILVSTVIWLVYKRIHRNRLLEFKEALESIRDTLVVLEDIRSYDGLLEIMEQDAGNRLKVRLQECRLEVEDDHQQVHLYLSFNPSFIEISRIKVAHPRTDIATRILEWLKNFAIENGIYYIRIGINETEAVQTFAQDHEFVLSQETKTWNLQLQKEK